MEGTWNEAVATQFVTPARNLPARTNENDEETQGSRTAGSQPASHISNPPFPETSVLPFVPHCSVTEQ